MKRTSGFLASHPVSRRTVLQAGRRWRLGGWSRRGGNMVQVNFGNLESWDLHGNNFPMLKNFLFPPTDLAVPALLTIRSACSTALCAASWRVLLSIH